MTQSVAIHGADGHDMPADDVILAKQAADLLYRKYPGYLWAVHVNSKGGMLNIFCPIISTRYGYTIRLSEVYQDPQLKCVMRAGGEILERADMRRGQWRDGELAKRVEGIKNYNPILR